MKVRTQENLVVLIFTLILLALAASGMYGCTKTEYEYFVNVKRQEVKQKVPVRSDSIAPPGLRGIVEVKEKEDEKD